MTLAVLVHAGLEGLRDGLPTPPLIERDPSDLSDEEREALDVRWLPRSLEEALAAAEAARRGARLVSRSALAGLCFAQAP